MWNNGFPHEENIAWFFHTWPYAVKGFDTEEELVEAFKSLKPDANTTDEYEATPPSPLLGGIVFKNMENGTEFPQNIQVRRLGLMT